MKNNPEDVISQLLGNKNLNLQRGDNSSFDYSRIPFGIPALDKLTGGVTYYYNNGIWMNEKQYNFYIEVDGGGRGERRGGGPPDRADPFQPLAAMGPDRRDAGPQPTGAAGGCAARRGPDPDRLGEGWAVAAPRSNGAARS